LPLVPPAAVDVVGPLDVLLPEVAVAPLVVIGTLIPAEWLPPTEAEISTRLTAALLGD